ncbi:MAG: bifunctional glutamate N-acetyltransferase/amino-acid acetyltransferase ArgJ [Planctomycetaceae bacterium]|nr:bifunctional glutamate N-acetyltransferase/amino-acid acetyltransferase ArgJ [Planctomycetaceae bacterium]
MTDSSPTHSLPDGFRAAGFACGLKTDPAKLDLSLFVSDVPCVAAGVFTQNRVVGAPVQVSRERVPSGSVRGVIINSGNSNACTGQQGLDDAKWMTAETAKGIGCDETDVLVCSTGVIGHFLPREKLAKGFGPIVEKLAGTPASLADAAKGMMTTDTLHKLASRSIEIDGQTVTVTGAAKGAAMIAPNMATMLAVLMTDAALSPERATNVLREAVNASFNCISVDGHTSTSDTVLLLANGQASGERQSPDTSKPSPALVTAITEVCADLAQQIIRDAEGAEHFVTIDVRGCTTRKEAAVIAKSVAESALVKTAITGNDPNWGRIVSAAGYAGIEFAESECSLTINGISLYEAGTPIDYDETAVSQAMSTGEVHIDLHFNRGDASVRYWTTDLTAEYVRLNSEYTT